MIQNMITFTKYERPSVPLKVYVLPNEKELIQKRADECRMSISEYLKNLGLGYAPKSMIDNLAVLHLLRIHGNMGRLGGLLKLLLSEQGDHLDGKSHRAEVNQLLRDMQETQAQILPLIKELKMKERA